MYGLLRVAFPASSMLLAVILASCGGSSPTASPTPVTAVGPTAIPTTATTAAQANATPAPGSAAAGLPFDEGVQLVESGEFDKAIDAFTGAIRLNPQYAAAFYNRGTAYLNLCQPQRAIEDLDEAIRLNPREAVVYANRAVVYTLLGDNPRAQQDVDQAVALGIDPTALNEMVERARTD